MRAFSLVEVLVSLAVGLAILAGLLRFSATTMNDLRRQRGRLTLTNSLDLARDQLDRARRGSEPAFWDALPPREDLFHPVDHSHGAAQFSGDCPDWPGNACLLIWDIHLGQDTPLIYRTDMAGYPDYLSMTPEDPTYPMGPHEAIGSGSVLLLASEAGAFAVLVSEVTGDQVRLVPPPSQPWQPPPEIGGGEYIGSHLGVLEVRHWYLFPEVGRRHLLSNNAWRWDGEAWHKERRVSSHGYIERLRWTPCTAGEPDRLLLVGMDSHAPLLSDPIFIAGDRYEREVIIANLAF